MITAIMFFRIWSKNTAPPDTPLPLTADLAAVSAALPLPVMPGGGFKEIETYHTAEFGSVARA